MNILGISCFYHDSAACLIKDGVVAAAASEERFNRRKNSPVFPINAVNFCLQEGGIGLYDVDYIGFYEKPFLKFHRVILSHLRSYPFSFKNFLDTVPSWLQERLIMPLVFKREMGYEGKSLFIKHHLSHAASSFLVSPFEEAAILTADGVGEWATMSCGAGRRNKIEISKEMRFPDSLGLVYTAVTTYLGFEALEGEGKVMGLAGYGKPVYLDKFYDMVAVKSDGSYRVNPQYFGFNKGSRMYTKKFVRAFGRERKPETELTERHYDIAASLQRLTEDMLINIANRLYEETKIDKLCMAGGLALNCVANGRILQESPFRDIFIQPAAGDSGGALGAASFIHHCLLGNARKYVFKDAYLGPGFSGQEMKRALLNNGIAFEELDDLQLFKYVAGLIAENKIIGWFQGRMEFGPRALGNRSILANPCNPGMKELLNARVKNREAFRPYAPVVLEGRAEEFFTGKQFSEFMLLAVKVRDEKKTVIPAVTHVDATARVQVAREETNPRLCSLIREFEKLTGVPVLINTSFNLRGEPIVCSPQDAINSFRKSNMDCLVLGNCVSEK